MTIMNETLINNTLLEVNKENVRKIAVSNISF